VALNPIVSAYHEVSWPDAEARGSMRHATMNHTRLHRRFAVGAIALLLAGLLPGSVSAATKPHSAATIIEPPVVLYTDIASGPITGGENNKGIYLSIFGKNFGKSSDMGVTTKVYIGGVEVDSYRYLGASRVAGSSRIQQITVQVGALGNPVLGTALPVDVKVNGIDSNTDIRFTPNPGNIYFVSTTGSDTTGVANDITHPYRHVQLPGIGNNGNAGCPISSGDQSVAKAGVWGIVHPGDFIVMRGGTWTDLARDNFFLRFQNKSGTAPTGAVGSGPISVIGYPTENAFINMDHTANSSVEGGISSADRARQDLGCGAWVTVADLRLESGGREGMITTQAGYANPAGSHWRVVNNELTAVSVDPNSPAKGAGVSGSGVGQLFYGNYIHDVHGGTPEHENHGFYVDGSGSYDIAYNWLKNISGGNGINVYGSSGTDPDNIQFHHNVIDGVGKHGLNIADGATHDLNFYDNLLYNIANYCLRYNTDSLSGNGVKVWNNTFYNCGTVRDDFGYGAVVANTWGPLSSSRSSVYNNIFVSATSGPDYLGGDTIGAVDSNLYYGTSDTTSYSSDSHAVVSSPLFTSTTPGLENFVLQAASPAGNAGTASVASLLQFKRDLSLDVTQPQGGLYAIGAYEPSGSPTPPSPTPSTYHPVAPVRLLDTRYANGLTGKLVAGTPRTFQITERGGPSNVPAGATAVTANVTVTKAGAASSVYLGPAEVAHPSTATFNFNANDNTASGSTIAIDPVLGTMSVTYMAASGTTDLVLDVTGYFVAGSGGDTFHALTPIRLLDTRTGNGATKAKVKANAPITFKLWNRGVPPTAKAVTGNLTVVNSTIRGAVYIGPDPLKSPTTSTINFAKGQIRANSMTVALSSTGSLSATYLATSGYTIDLVFDVTGYYTADLSGDRYVPITPAAYLDTRPNPGVGLTGKFSANVPRTFAVRGLGDVAADATGVTGIVSVYNQTGTFAIYVGPVATTKPPTSTLNFVVGNNCSNGVTVALADDGSLAITYMGYGTNTTNAEFVVTGYFVK